MDAILHRYGLYFSNYTVVMAVGVLLAVGLVWWLVGKQPALSQPKWPYADPSLRATWFDGILILLAAGLVGGRIGFVVGAWDYFQIHPNEAWHLWQGGLSYHGALLAGGMALGLWSRRQNLAFDHYLGLYAPGFALLVLFGWGACWLDGCAYGQETTLGWLAADLPNTYGVFAVRYQTQVGGMLTGLVALVAPCGLSRWLRVDSPARLFGLTLLLVSVGHLLVGLGRGDDLPLLWGWSIGLWLDGVLALIGLLVVWRGVSN
jgi:phosphatidylglycerol---prolipoprotein diacylglyceryl transferase